MVWEKGLLQHQLSNVQGSCSFPSLLTGINHHLKAGFQADSASSELLLLTRSLAHLSLSIMPMLMKMPPGLLRRINRSPVPQGPVVFYCIWREFPPTSKCSTGRLSPGSELSLFPRVCAICSFSCWLDCRAGNELPEPSPLLSLTTSTSSTFWLSWTSASVKALVLAHELSHSAFCSVYRGS